MTQRWFELLAEDHTTIEKVFAAMEQAFATSDAPPASLVADVVQFLSNYVERCHNKKEEEHLFPLLRARGIPVGGGPLAVMLAEHERQKTLVERTRDRGLAYAGGDAAALAAFRATFSEYAALCKDHYWKENDILFPMALHVMEARDEEAVLQGIRAVETSLGEDARERYYALAEKIAQAGEIRDLSYGLDREVLAYMLNTLPVELSFVDADDAVRYFSHENHAKIFPRNRSAIGVKVQNCHPPKSVHLVNRILADFKAGKRDVAEFWIDFQGKFVHIRYFPVRDAAGKYLGCMEVVQDVESIRALEGERRLLVEGRA
ncbi:MAG: PAS domain-containing protein [Planctomycetota bacterium]